MPGQMSVDDLGNILEAVKRGQVDNAEAGGARFQFVDVREEDELKQAKLDGFVNLPLSKFEEWGPKLRGDHALLDRNKEVVVLCHHGMRSNQMAQHLATKEGFPRVWNVEGGIHAYAKEVDPSVGSY